MLHEMIGRHHCHATSLSSFCFSAGFKYKMPQNDAFKAVFIHPQNVALLPSPIVTIDCTVIQVSIDCIVLPLSHMKAPSAKLQWCPAVALDDMRWKISGPFCRSRPSPCDDISLLPLAPETSIAVLAMSLGKRRTTLSKAGRQIYAYM